MASAILLLLIVGIVASTRTLVMIKYGNKAVDARKLPVMMAEAFGTSRRLTEEDRVCEECLMNDDMVEDLKAVGVQIIKSNCPATTTHIANYMKKAHDALNVDVFVEPDREVFRGEMPKRSSLRRTQSGCEPNPRLGTNDPLSSCQPNLELVHTASAWEAIKKLNETTPLKEVVVAVFDSGIDPEHPDLVNRLWRNPEDGSVGYNFLDDNTNVTDDDSGHGTRCAGLVAAETNNNIGIASIGGPLNVKIMTVKFLGGAEGRTGDAIKALDFAIQHGAQVSSHSYVNSVESDILREALTNAAARGHVIVAAAGNDGRSLDKTPNYPCSYSSQVPSILCVAATTSDPTSNITLARLSNFGSAVNIAAPGLKILSTVPGGYEYDDGTSMAAPQVAAVAAILVSLGVPGQNITDVIVRTGGVLTDSDIPFLNVSAAVASYNL